jgi:hypothetical protein
MNPEARTRFVPDLLSDPEGVDRLAETETYPIVMIVHGRA